MRSGLVTSVILHVAILAWALFTIQSQQELRMPEPDPIVTGLISESEFTKLRQGVRTAKQMEAQAKPTPKADIAKKEAPKPTPVAAAPPPPEPPAPKEEVKPGPKKDPIAEKLASAPPPPAPAAPPPVPAPEEQKKLEEILKEQERQAEDQKKAEEQRTAEEERKIEEQKQAELKKKLDEAKKRKEAELKKKREEEKKRKEAEAKKKFDAEKISALLNKIPDKGAPTPSSPLDEQAKALKGPVLGAPEGRDTQISASELAILAQRIRQCVQSKWNVLGGGESAQNTQVKIRLRFKPDGSLNGAPVIMNPQGSAYFMAVSESAIRAVQACDPFNLPPEKYEVWKDIVLNFDPRDMF